MFLRIQIIEEKIIIGKKIMTTLAANNMATVFGSFMPSVKNILHRPNSEIISMQVYSPLLDWNTFTENTLFEKWAACEVYNVESTYTDLEYFTIPSGLYAVFLHKGDSKNAAQTFQYIFSEWLHSSEYNLDNRPHFEILGDKYIRENENSEEEVWIPVIKKQDNYS
jgi:AraC family transcriptional regulator